MSDLSSYVPELLRLVRLTYPDWQDFSNEQFVRDELDYKREGSEFAREQLSREALAGLLDAADYDGFLARLRAVANKTNLLYLGTPRTGDLALISQDDADPDPLCRAVFDLLHGEGDATHRLDAFSRFVGNSEPKLYWPFPTYYLYMLYPEREILVKPDATRWLSKLTGGAIPYKSRPSGQLYSAIREGFHALRDALAPHGATDMIDVQSTVYVAYKAAIDAPFEKAVKRLRQGLAELPKIDDFRYIEADRDKVYARYGPLFTPESIPDLTAETFASFLDFKENRHWSGIDQNVKLVISDMPALRQALLGLLDDGRSLAERFDAARRVKGLGKARITPFLLVARPRQYGVWNTIAEKGLRQLGIFPELEAKATEGEQYEAVNDMLLRLSAALETDLWTLDALWGWLNQTPPPEQRYWRITLPSDMRRDLSDGRGDYNFWADCLAHGVAAIGFDNQPGDPQIAKFAAIQPGDRVAAFLRNRTIGGVGVVTSPMDEMTEKERPADQDFFHGGMWRRIGVDWTPKTIRVDDLPKDVQNKFGQSTVVELTADEFHAVEKLMDDSPPQAPAAPGQFEGFTQDAFDFLRDLAANNNKLWMAANHERWEVSVREPMRALFIDLGPRVKRTFDPYLLPDELEITPTAHKVLARINKNWSATPDSKYYEYYWGAFYRRSLTRQTDAQLFVTITPDKLRFGFYFGEQAKREKREFKERILADPEAFLNLLTELGLAGHYDFIRTEPDNRWEMRSIHTLEDLSIWLEDDYFDVLTAMTPQEAIAAGPALVDTILDTFRRVFPIYLWAVADEPEVAVERYLAAEFPIDDGDEDPPPPPYTFGDFLDRTHLTSAAADDLRAMLEDKRQVIFYGPPGTGKTWVARHLARLLTGLADPPREQLEIVQFHPAYGYEEFIEGIRPESKSHDGQQIVTFPTRPGVFVRFCRQAELVDGPCVFIIDEINRGNISRIFGELMLLLEYRDQSIPLPYSGQPFRIPPNVYVIGTMNTADRSIALVDFALRRRFHFAHFAADPDLFDRWLARNPSPLPYLKALYRRLAREAIDDPDFAIGPSLFMRAGLDEAGLRRVWQWSIMPYLREYHLDDSERVEQWAWDGTLMRQLRGQGMGEPTAEPAFVPSENDDDDA